MGLNAFASNYGVKHHDSHDGGSVTFHENYSLDVRGTTYTYNNVWVASLNDMVIYEQNPAFSPQRYPITSMMLLGTAH
jgi:hypothetical protein